MEQATIKVAIIETSVYGALAYQARCLNCGWETRRYDREATALKHGTAHRCDSLDSLK